jgi:hypothetical protein
MQPDNFRVYSALRSYCVGSMLQDRLAITTVPITLNLDAEAARLFTSASSEQQQKLEVLVSLLLVDMATSSSSLRAVMDTISVRARERGVTEEQLQRLLEDAEELDAPGGADTSVQPDDATMR